MNESLLPSSENKYVQQNLADRFTLAYMSYMDYIKSFYKDACT